MLSLVLDEVIEGVKNFNKPGRSDVSSGYNVLTASAFRATVGSHRILSPKTCAKT